MKLYIVVLPILASCGVGTYGESSGDDGGGGDGGTEDKNLCVDRSGTPATAYGHGGNAADTRAGQGCVVAGCHLTGNLGAGAPAFAYAGTAYKDINGATPNPGAVVRLFPAGGKKSVAKAITDSAGNFYVSDPGLTAFPYETDITACGADAAATNSTGIRIMVGKITKAEANCNAGNTCHAVPKQNGTPVYLLD